MAGTSLILFAAGQFNAFFYSLVSKDTSEMYYANRRQQFLIEQGYNYLVLQDSSVDRMGGKSESLVYAGEEAELALLKQVLQSVCRGEGPEADEEDEAPAVPVAPAAPAERVSLSSLSGGLDGSCMVSSSPAKKRLKHSNSQV